MKIWIALFTAAVFGGGACLGIALDRTRGVAPSTESVSGRYGELSVSRFADELGLTSEQDRDLDLILDETRRDFEAYARARAAAQERSKERVMGILTEEQKKKLNELISAERRKRAEAEVDKLVKAYAKLLALSETQIERVRQALMEGKNRRHEYFSQRKAGWEPGQMRSFFKAYREEQNGRVQTILSPEQFVRYMEIQNLEH